MYICEQKKKKRIEIPLLKLMWNFIKKKTTFLHLVFVHDKDNKKNTKLSNAFPARVLISIAILP